MKNQVLSDDFRRSDDFYRSDRLLQHFLQRSLPEVALAALRPQLDYTGKAAATEMDALSMTADKEPPRLVKRDFYGRTIDRIEFHPAYERLKAIAVRTGMFGMKWEPRWRANFAAERHRLGFSVGFLYAMSEAGLYCPLCMTDGVALLIDKYGNEADKARLMPHIYTDNPDALYTGAMFLTEKAGGSDVGANLVTATLYDAPYYHLNGEKWFCSNANADLIFALARTRSEVAGTRGLGIFLIERQKPDGSANPMQAIRLKDKLGVRSMASAEYILDNTLGKLVGGETEGFKIMTDMINLSRMYNSVTAIALSRRALIESYQFLKYRTTFGRNALQHALVRSKLTELMAIYTANFYLTWYSVEQMDRADNGDDVAKERLRLLTPMVKKGTAQDGVYLVREAMELMGGMGYIEDGVMPKLMRDMMVLPIWEGAGNIMVLDVLRVLTKTQALKHVKQEIDRLIGDNAIRQEAEVLRAEWAKAEQLLYSTLMATPTDQDRIETLMRPWTERVTRLLQIALLLHYEDDHSRDWIRPALDYLVGSLRSNELRAEQPLSVEAVEEMLAWTI